MINTSKWLIPWSQSFLALQSSFDYKKINGCQRHSEGESQTRESSYGNLREVLGRYFNQMMNVKQRAAPSLDYVLLQTFILN